MWYSFGKGVCRCKMFAYKMSSWKMDLQSIALYEKWQHAQEIFSAGNSWGLKDYMGKMKNAACLVLCSPYVCPLIAISRGGIQDWMDLCTSIPVLGIESCGLFSRIFWNIKKNCKELLFCRATSLLYRAYRSNCAAPVSMLLLVLVEVISLLRWTSLGFGQNNVDVNTWCSAMWENRTVYIRTNRELQTTLSVSPIISSSRASTGVNYLFLQSKYN